MNRLKKAAKTRVKQIKREFRALARELKTIERLFGKRKKRARKVKVAVAKPRHRRARKAAAAPVQAAA